MADTRGLTREQLLNDNIGRGTAINQEKQQLLQRAGVSEVQNIQKIQQEQKTGQRAQVHLDQDDISLYTMGVSWLKEKWHHDNPEEVKRQQAIREQIWQQYDAKAAIEDALTTGEVVVTGVALATGIGAGAALLRMGVVAAKKTAQEGVRQVAKKGIVEKVKDYGEHLSQKGIIDKLTHAQAARLDKLTAAMKNLTPGQGIRGLVQATRATITPTVAASLVAGSSAAAAIPMAQNKLLRVEQKEQDLDEWRQLAQKHPHVSAMGLIDERNRQKGSVNMHEQDAKIERTIQQKINRPASTDVQVNADLMRNLQRKLD